MKKFYYLSTCNTCTKIIKTLELPTDIEMQDVKTHPLSIADIEKMHELSGSYKALLNKRARKYQEQGLKDKNLQEEEIKNLLLEHYTFLKRPVLVLNQQIFIGNSNKTVENAKIALHNG